VKNQHASDVKVSMLAGAQPMIEAADNVAPARFSLPRRTIFL
jgi:hypothetical protein